MALQVHFAAQPFGQLLLYRKERQPRHMAGFKRKAITSLQTATNP
jgi:hypothetical protein